MRKVMIGCGNLLAGDDGVGIYVIQRLKEKGIDGIEYIEGGTADLHLLNYILDQEEVVLIDAAMLGEQEGELFCLEGEDFCHHMGIKISFHDVGIEDVLSMGYRFYPLRMPKSLRIYGITVKEIKMGIGLSSAVQRGAEKLVQKLYELELGGRPLDRDKSGTGVKTNDCRI